MINFILDYLNNSTSRINKFIVKLYFIRKTGNTQISDFYNVIQIDE